MTLTVRKNLNFPKELVDEITETGRRNFRDFTAEVLFRCVSHTPATHIPHTSDTPDPVSSMHTAYMPEVHPIHAGGVSDAHPIHILYTPDTPVQTYVEEPETPSDRAEMLDMLLADGEPKSIKSNFQVRRRKQVEFLIQQWAEMFPTNRALTDTLAKQFLTLSGESAVEVLAAFEIAVNRGVEGNGTVGYVTKVLKNRAEKAMQPPEAQKPKREQMPWEGEIALREPTAEDLAKLDLAKELWERTSGSGERSAYNT